MNTEFISHTGNRTHFRLFPLTPDRLDTALALCDACVGKHMYSRQELQHAMTSPNHEFLLAVCDDGTVAGYMYHYLEALENLPVFSKLKPEQVSHAGISPKTQIGNLQSIGILGAYRGSGLSRFLMQTAMDSLVRHGAEALLGVCWKIGEAIPMGKIMTELHFSYLCDAEKFWYDNESLHCPYCGGRCNCSAAVYYKSVPKERES